MAFGQPSGTPASHQQMRELAALLEALGYASFREARGPLGLTQRQGGGKFTAAEAAGYIERLEAEVENGPAEPAPQPTPRPRPKATAPTSRKPTTLREVPAAELATELERRGWIVIPPESETPTEPRP